MRSAATLQVSLSSYLLAGVAVFKMLARAKAAWSAAQVPLPYTSQGIWWPCVVSSTCMKSGCMHSLLRGCKPPAQEFRGCCTR